MKKAILGLAFLTIASFSFSAAAQTQTDKQCKSKTECVSKDKKCCKDGKNAKGDRRIRGQKRVKPNLFEGIELTTEQKGRIEALDNASKVSRQELKAKAKTARENKDTTYDVRKANRELRSKYVNDLGEILTSDQMIVFLKNYYVNSPSHHGGKKAIAMKHGKGHKFDKGQRQGKGPRNAEMQMKAQATK